MEQKGRCHVNRQAAPTQMDTPWPHRVRSALALSACAEALAAPFSGKPLPEAAEVTTALAHPDPRLHRPACGSTQMLVVAEHFAGREGKLDEDSLAAALARRCGSHDSAGDSLGTHKVLADVEKGVPWWESALALHNRQGSYGNDAAVRATPIGLLPRTGVGTIALLARRSATITHTHQLARDGAAVHAVAVALAANMQPSAAIDANRFLATVAAHIRTLEFRAALGIVRTLVRHRAGPAETAATVGHDGTALRSVPAALAAYLRHPDEPVAAIRYAILIGGDAPAIAAMTGALAGARCPAFVAPAGWSALTDTAAIDSAATALSGIVKP